MRSERSDCRQVRQFRDLGGSKPWPSGPDGEQCHPRVADRCGGELGVTAPIVGEPGRIGLDDTCGRQREPWQRRPPDPGRAGTCLGDGDATVDLVDDDHPPCAQHGRRNPGDGGQRSGCRRAEPIDDVEPVSELVAFGERLPGFDHDCGQHVELGKNRVGRCGVLSFDEHVVDRRRRAPLHDVHSSDVTTGLADRARERTEGARPIGNADSQEIQHDGCSGSDCPIHGRAGLCRRRCTDMTLRFRGPSVDGAVRQYVHDGR